jgi:hypothetical protein
MTFQDYFELYFTTATIKDWKWLLKPDKYKKIITDSFAYLATTRYRKNGIWRNKQRIIAFHHTVFMKWANRKEHF